MAKRYSIAEIYKFGNELESLCEKYGVRLGFGTNDEEGFFDFTDYGGFKSIRKQDIRGGCFIISYDPDPFSDKMWMIEVTDIEKYEGCLEEKFVQTVLEYAFTDSDPNEV